AAGPYQAAFGTSSLTVALATTAGALRAERLRGWCEQVLRDLHAEAGADLFLITHLSTSSTGSRGDQTGGVAADPGHLFLDPIWWQPFRQTPVALLDLTGVEQSNPREDLHSAPPGR